MPPSISTVKTTAEQILSHPTWDIVVIFALVAIGFFYGLTAGRRRIVSTIIYTYVALAIFMAMPIDKFSSLLGVKESFAMKIAVFLILWLLLIFLLGGKRGRSLASAGSWWQVFLLGFVQAGFLIHVLVNFLPPDRIKFLAPLTRTVFANPALHIWWLVLPVTVLIFIRWLEVRDEW